MFSEYAIDPACLARWEEFRYLVEKFGWDRGRVIARFPKSWAKMVYESLHCSPVQRAKAEVMLRALHAAILPRGGSSYDGQRPWLENALAEHTRREFHAILTPTPPTPCPASVLSSIDLDESEERWRTPCPPVPRTAAALTRAVGLLLRSSNRICLIDPYFDAHQPRFANMLTALAGVAAIGRAQAGDVSFEIHTSVERSFRRDEYRSPLAEQKAADYVLEGCRRVVSRLPSGVSLILRVWKEKLGGERIHNRYILSERGGISLPIGLDAADPDSGVGTDDVTRLSVEQYHERWHQYVDPGDGFDEILNASIT